MMSGIDEIPARLVDNVRRHDIGLDKSIENDASIVVDFINGLISRTPYWVPPDQYNVSFIQSIMLFMPESNGWTIQYCQLVVGRVASILNK